MRIDDTGLSGVNPERTDKAGHVKAEDATTAKLARDQSDQVQLSILSERVRVLANESPDRATKIEELAKAVDAGSYQADPIEVGKRIIDDALDVAVADRPKDAAGGATAGG